MGVVVQEPIEEEHGAGRVESSCEHRENQARVGRKSIREMEGGDEDEWATES